MKKAIKHLISAAVVACLTLSSTTAKAAAADEQASASEMVVSYDTGHLIVNGLSESTRIEVCNMLGVKIFSASTQRSDNSFSLNLRKGIYIVRVGAEVRRIAVR